MKDGFERKTEYLRISLTDRCNLRCQYCMPSQGVTFRRHEDMMKYEEMLRLVEILAGAGVKKVRLTGGEPTVRRDLTWFVKELSGIRGIEQIGLTTNGLKFAEMADELYDAGLRLVNISLDTLNEEVYKYITGQYGAKKVMDAVNIALMTGYKVKVNCVPLKEINERYLPEVAYIARDRAVDVRFIELMPIGCGKAFEGVPTEDVKTILKNTLGIYREETEFLQEIGEEPEFAGPAKYVRFKDFEGRCGFISPMSDCFCDRCNRLRLTADGCIKPCLYSDEKINICSMMRAGASDEDILAAIHEVLSHKNQRHSFGRDILGQEHRRMNEIGG